MIGGWDLFIDEQKDGGRVVRLGALCIEVGVTPQFTKTLLDRRSKVGNTHYGIRLGIVHWTALGGPQADVAEEWVAAYSRTPMVFFVRVDLGPRESKGHAVRRLIDHLETAPGAPRGFTRASTVLHLDYDSGDTGLIRDLRLKDGLLRVYAWDDHGSPLSQLADLLLGLTEAETSKRLDGSSLTGKMVEKRRVLDRLRSEMKRRRAAGSGCALVVLDANAQARVVF